MTNLDRATTLATASDAKYFHLLKGLVRSVARDETASRLALSVLDLGLSGEQLAWLRGQGAGIAPADWDIEFPGMETLPGHFRAMLARPFLPRYFPGHDIYIWIDADTWIQDGTVLNHYQRAAREGKLAIVPELDRSYFTMYKRPRIFGWNGAYRGYRFAFGFRVANRMAGNPFLNAGVFALHKDSPHWDLYERNLTHALNRRGRPEVRADNGGWLIEQSALNHVVYMDKAPTSLLPAYCNWFCALGTPHYDRERGCLVEPNEPHRPIGIVHLAGKDVQERAFDLPIRGRDGETVSTTLTHEAIRSLNENRG